MVLRRQIVLAIVAMAYTVRTPAAFCAKPALAAPRAVVARAEAAEKTEKSEAAPWSPPSLDPNTPSPIFGGSTGGLLSKAQVSES